MRLRFSITFASSGRSRSNGPPGARRIRKNEIVMIRNSVGIADQKPAEDEGEHGASPLERRLCRAAGIAKIVGRPGQPAAPRVWLYCIFDRKRVG